TKSLRSSEELLRDQQVELQQVNEELEEKASLLAEQNRKVEQKNDEVEAARLELEDKAEQLALSSKYKSEFLANMSHEVRTPLNPLLILAKLLSDNDEGTLSEKQVEFARTIYNAGSDLLELINDILDLSKVEAGKMDVHVARLEPKGIADYVERSFRPLAEQKVLDFEVSVAPDAPATLSTDEQRLQQVLKNLLSNAFQFTEKGGIKLEIGGAPADVQFATPSLAHGDVVRFTVRDSGVGIPADKLRLIFEAFQQADGTTSRRYGGTGLGLSISREIARLLGGEIHVESTQGEGSTFTLYLPAACPVPVAAAPVLDEGIAAHPAAARVRRRADSAALPDTLTDDRSELPAGERVVLVMTGDRALARGAVEGANDHGFRCVLAVRADAARALFPEFIPDAVVVSRDLPQLNGDAVLDHLKRHPETRHLPVYVLGGAEPGEDGAVRNLRHAGALGCVDAPTAPEQLGEVFDELSRFI